LSDGGYSVVADAQLDELESGDNPDLYNAVLDICEMVFLLPEQAQSGSSAIQTEDGIRFRFPVPGFNPFKVFWANTPEGPRIEAVFPHP